VVVVPLAHQHVGDRRLSTDNVYLIDSVARAIFTYQDKVVKLLQRSISKVIK